MDAIVVLCLIFYASWLKVKRLDFFLGLSVYFCCFKNHFWSYTLVITFIITTVKSHVASIEKDFIAWEGNIVANMIFQ